MRTTRNRGVPLSVDTMATPNSGLAAARRVELTGSTGKMHVLGLPTDLDITGVVYYAAGDSTVDCTSEADADGFVEPKAYGAVITLKEGATHVCFFAGTDFTIVYGEVE